MENQQQNSSAAHPILFQNSEKCLWKKFSLKDCTMLHFIFLWNIPTWKWNKQNFWGRNFLLFKSEITDLWEKRKITEQVNQQKWHCLTKYCSVPMSNCINSETSHTYNCVLVGKVLWSQKWSLMSSLNSAKDFCDSQPNLDLFILRFHAPPQRRTNHHFSKNTWSVPVTKSASPPTEPISHFMSLSNEKAPHILSTVYKAAQNITPSSQDTCRLPFKKKKQSLNVSMDANETVRLCTTFKQRLNFGMRLVFHSHSCDVQNIIETLLFINMKGHCGE